jgi:hypothetical protein
MKHWDLLEKYAEKYDTHQKVLEMALENMDHGIKQHPQSKEEELWTRMGRDMNSTCIIPKDGYKELITTANFERFQQYAARQRPLEYLIEFYCQKPLTDCSLEEIIDGIVVSGKLTNFFDAISYKDNGGFYALKVTHDLGIHNSKIIEILIDGMFKTYGAMTEIKTSERGLFIKVFKN